LLVDGRNSGCESNLILDKEILKMKKVPVALILVLATLDVVPMLAQSPKYSSLNEYLMARDVEIALAKSAAPDYISGHATIKVFTASGFETVHGGDNGFVCVVMRGFTGASLAAYRVLEKQPLRESWLASSVQYMCALTRLNKPSATPRR